VATSIAGRLTGEARSPEEIRDVVDLFSGDVGAKQSRFWLLLVLSTVVATAGVLSDSTATVIGAMIIAPLATPIQGVAAAISAGEMRGLLQSLAMVLGASLVVIVLAAGLAALLPELKPLSDNSQVTSRVSPTIIDLVAAAATGLAGAFAVARRDIGDILPGVAIAISLVPPLAVVGVTAVDGDWSGSLGALVLFLTNVLAMIVMGVALFAGLGVLRSRRARSDFRPVYAVLGISGAIVVAALAVATYRAVQLSTWQDAATRVGEVWAQGNGDRLVQARFDGDTLVVVVEGAGTAGDDARLPRLLHGSVPDGTPVIVNRVAGARRHVGDVRKPDQA
jgi:uncharacterized hydrophobic protein (TIGR00271 family)